MNTPVDGFLNGMDDDLDPNAGNHSRPDEGKGRYVLSRLYPKDTFKKGRIVVAELIVMQPAPGSNRQPGAMVSISYLVTYKGPSGMADRYAKARLRDFTRALLGLPEGTDTLPHANRLMQPAQPGRGIIIDITGEKNGEFMNYAYAHVGGQNQNTVVAMRQKLDASGYQPPAVNQQQQAHPPQNQQQQNTGLGNFTPSHGGGQQQQQAAPNTGFDPFGGGGGGFGGGFNPGGDIPY